MVSVSAKRQVASYLQEQYSCSERRACEVIKFPWSTHRFSLKRYDSNLDKQIRELSLKHPRLGIYQATESIFN